MWSGIRQAKVEECNRGFATGIRSRKQPRTPLRGRPWRRTRLLARTDERSVEDHGVRGTVGMWMSAVESSVVMGLLTRRNSCRDARNLPVPLEGGPCLAGFWPLAQ